MKNVFFNEYNIRMGPLSYLPLVSGLLRAHAETSEIVRQHYTFAPFIYAIDSPETILAQYDNPGVAAFSAVMWNERLCLTVAEEVKRRWPGCLIVFGGPQVPHHPLQYMEEHSFIDICVRAEGEEAFTDILIQHTKGYNFFNIPNVTWAGGENDDERPFSRDLDVLPSPYLEGLYDTLLESKDSFQAIIETNRGCPFHCTFCYWGRGGLSRKYKYFGMERVLRELEWCADHEIKYVFNADSNFGMNKRDVEVAEYLVDLKKRTGYPDKFRTCFGKNTDDKIFHIGSMFHEAQLEKGITLARQSNDATVLKNIKRSNISMETYENLQVRFNKEDIPIYSEIILGLPGETTETWKRGINELLEAGLRNQLFIYFCQVYPNTDLGDREYQKEFGVKTVRIPLNEIHGSIRDDSLVTEYEDIVIGTNSMSTREWRDMAVLSWMTMLMHSLKLGYFIMEDLARRGIPHIDFINHLVTYWDDVPEILGFHKAADRILTGEGRGIAIPDCGGIYWDVEEAAFISCMRDADAFYDYMLDLLKALLPDDMTEVVRYQQSRIPPIRTDVEQWACETVLWGRKSGTMLVPV